MSRSLRLPRAIPAAQLRERTIIARAIAFVLRGVVSQLIMERGREFASCDQLRLWYGARRAAVILAWWRHLGMARKFGSGR